MRSNTIRAASALGLSDIQASHSLQRASLISGFEPGNPHGQRSERKREPWLRIKRLLSGKASSSRRNSRDKRLFVNHFILNGEGS